MNKITQLSVPYTNIMTFTVMEGSYQAEYVHRYLDTEMYVIKDNKLYNLVEDVNSEELYVPIKKDALLVYQAHLDGEPIGLEEAKEKYPEEFI